MTTTEENQIRSDLLTLLICYRMHLHEPATLRMAKVKDCCQLLLERTDNKTMIESYCQIIRGIYDRRFVDVTMILNATENNYAKVYMNV